MEQMMNGGMACGMSMMIGMGLVAALLIGTLALVAAAAIKVLRSGSSASDRATSSNLPGAR